MKLPFTFSGSLAINSKLRCETLLQILQKHFYIELKQKQGLLMMSKALQPFPVENFRCGQMGNAECDFTPKWKLHQAAETGKTLESTPRFDPLLHVTSWKYDLNYAARSVQAVVMKACMCMVEKKKMLFSGFVLFKYSPWRILGYTLFLLNFGNVKYGRLINLE